MLTVFVLVSQFFGMVVGFVVPLLVKYADQIKPKQTKPPNRTEPNPFRRYAAEFYEEWKLRHDPWRSEDDDEHALGRPSSRSRAPTEAFSAAAGPPAALTRRYSRRRSSLQSISTDHGGGVGGALGGDSFWARAERSQYFRLVRGLLCPTCANRDKKIPQMSVYEDQAKLVMFDSTTGLSGVIPMYMKLMIQIGYIVLFAPVFPLAALICLLANVCRLRADAYLLLFNTQRPPFRCTQNIGSLRTALRTLSALAVATHVGLLVFTSTQVIVS